MKSYVLHANDKDRPGVFENLTKFLAELSESKSWRIEIKEYKKPRSRDANAYLWTGVYAVWCRAEGYNAEILHEWMCGDFWGVISTEISGKVYTRPWRTTTTNEFFERDVLSGKPFWDFVNHVRRRADENGIKTLEPGEWNPAIYDPI